MHVSHTLLPFLRRFVALTFSRRNAHHGTTVNFSFPAASATGGQQALHHSWTCHTPVCGTNTKNSTAELLIVKRIQLLLVFSGGFQPPQGVINLDPAFQIATPLVLEQRSHLQEFPALSIFCFPQHCQISNRRVRAVRKVLELLELFTQSTLGVTDSTGDAEEYKRVSKTVVFAGALLALLAMLVWLLAIKVWFE